MSNQSHYSPNVPGQYTPPPAPAPAPHKQKMPLWAKLVLIFVGGPLIVVGAVGAMLGGSGAAQVTSSTRPAATTSTYDPGIQTPATKAKPDMTASQEQAVGAARDYLNVTAFSRLGLIQQLSSRYGEGFSTADATFAVDYIGADWNEQAAKSAKAYLAMQHFSRAGLIQQLESRYGEQFTHAQAVYGVKAAGL